MKFITNIIASTLAVMITAWFLPGVRVNDFMTAVLVAVVLAFLNTVVKPILTILTIPITFFTLGLFLLVINAFMIILVTRLVDGFYVDGFWKALLFSLILSLTTSVLNMFAGNNENSNKEE